MTYYLHLRLRDRIPERYIIRTSRAGVFHDKRTNDSCEVIGEFETAVEAYNAAAARGGARIYKGVRGDFERKVYNRDDLGDIV